MRVGFETVTPKRETTDPTEVTGKYSISTRIESTQRTADRTVQYTRVSTAKVTRALPSTRGAVRGVRGIVTHAHSSPELSAVAKATCSASLPVFAIHRAPRSLIRLK